MYLANIPENATIQEIPVDWDNMVEILFYFLTIKITIVFLRELDLMEIFISSFLLLVFYWIMVILIFSKNIAKKKLSIDHFLDRKEERTDLMNMSEAIKKLIRNYDFESETEFYECLEENQNEVINHLEWRVAGGKTKDENIGNDYIEACKFILSEIKDA